MTAVISSPARSGLFANALRYVVEEKRASVEWIVVAHNDPELLSRVKGVTGSASGVLEVPQSQWDFQSNDFSETLQWAINVGSARHLLLVGHSQGSEMPASPQNDSEPTGNRLFARTRRTLRQTDISKQDFADKVDSLYSNETVRQAASSGQLQIHTLFYLEYCRTFFKFNAMKNEYRPLHESDPN